MSAIPQPSPEVPSLSHSLRCAVGGLLMGLANLVPGISGGTMLLAAGVYPDFINAVAGLSTLKLSRRVITVLALVGGMAACAVLLFAGVVKSLVVEHRWIMYSIFIGLTLGGVPLIYKMLGKLDRRAFRAACTGFAGMAVLAWLQTTGEGGAYEHAGVAFMFMAGVAGASAMILPGVSGGYLLLLLGVYVPILGAIDATKEALKARSLDALLDPVLHVVLPVGIGVVVGIVVVSNLLKVVMARYERPTLGVLLGLLLGAVVGLWPFQKPVAPSLGSLFRGQEVTASILQALPPEKYPTIFFSPSIVEVLGSLILIGTGFMVTMAVARMSAVKPSEEGALAGSVVENT